MSIPNSWTGTHLSSTLALYQQLLRDEARRQRRYSRRAAHDHTAGTAAGESAPPRDRSTSVNWSATPSWLRSMLQASDRRP